MNSDAIPSVLGAIERIGPAAKILLTSVQHRSELAALEAGEARDHLMVTAGAAVGAVAGLVLIGFALTFTVAAFVWDRDDRGLILGGLTVLYLIVTAALALWVRKRLIHWAPLPETRNQLRADCASITSILPDLDS